MSDYYLTEVQVEQAREIATLRAENERLRTALEQLASYPNSEPRIIEQIAREALGSAKAG